MGTQGTKGTKIATQGSMDKGHKYHGQGPGLRAQGLRKSIYLKFEKIGLCRFDPRPLIIRFTRGKLRRKSNRYLDRHFAPIPNFDRTGTVLDHVVP